MTTAKKRLVNHSLPRFNGLTIAKGIVNWLDNGVEFSTSGFDTMYTPDGTVQPKAYVGIERYTLDGDKLVAEYSMKKYALATDPDGNKLLVPNFDKPWGKSIKLKRVSQPRGK